MLCHHCFKQAQTQFCSHDCRIEHEFKKLVPGGWQVTGTGGGCTAWQKSLPDGDYFLLTDMGGLSHPLTTTEQVLLGQYNSEGVLQGGTMKMSLEDALGIGAEEIKEVD